MGQHPAGGLLLPGPLQRWIEGAAETFLQPAGTPALDFTQPRGEAALFPPDSLSWRVFRNPLVLFVGGVAAVLLELAEPRVRAGVWEHSRFRTDPVLRMRRTGLAALVTVYGARSVAERMIAGIVRTHDDIMGVTPAGEAYRASDPDLLTWVQATASYGFAEAYRRYAGPLDDGAFDRLLAEAVPAARLYGASGAPASRAELDALFAAVRPRLEPSPVVFEFLGIVHRAPILPGLLRPAQGMLVRAAVELLPDWLRGTLGLTAAHGLRPWEAPLVRAMGRLANKVMLRSAPAAQACLRLGLPAGCLYQS